MQNFAVRPLAHWGTHSNWRFVFYFVSEYQQKSPFSVSAVPMSHLCLKIVTNFGKPNLLGHSNLEKVNFMVLSNAFQRENHSTFSKTRKKSTLCYLNGKIHFLMNFFGSFFFPDHRSVRCRNQFQSQIHFHEAHFLLIYHPMKYKRTADEACRPSFFF